MDHHLHLYVKFFYMSDCSQNSVTSKCDVDKKPPTLLKQALMKNANKVEQERITKEEERIDARKKELKEFIKKHENGNHPPTPSK